MKWYHLTAFVQCFSCDKYFAYCHRMIKSHSSCICSHKNLCLQVKMYIKRVQPAFASAPQTKFCRFNPNLRPAITHSLPSGMRVSMATHLTSIHYISVMFSRLLSVSARNNSALSSQSLPVSAFHFIEWIMPYWNGSTLLFWGWNRQVGRSCDPPLYQSSTGFLWKPKELG